MAQQVPGTRGIDSTHQKDAVTVGVEMAPLTNGTSSGTTVSSSITANGGQGVITTPTLTTAAGSTHTLTVTNNVVTAGDIVWAQVGNGTNTLGQPSMANVTPAAGSFTAVIQNIHGSSAFSGTLTVAFAVLKAAPSPL